MSMATRGENMGRICTHQSKNGLFCESENYEFCQKPIICEKSAWTTVLLIKSFLDANLGNISKLVQVSKLGDFCKHDGDFYNMV